MTVYNCYTTLNSTTLKVTVTCCWIATLKLRHTTFSSLITSYNGVLCVFAAPIMPFFQKFDFEFDYRRLVHNLLLCAMNFTDVSATK